MKFLALDQSINTTGWAIYDNDNLIDFGHFTVSATKPIEERLVLIMRELSKIVENHEVNFVFFEDIQNQQNLETYKKLAYVQAIIMFWCYSYELKFSILSSAHWRGILKEKYKINFGKVRNEQKKTALSFVLENFKKEVTEDEADAICLGLAGIIEKKRNQSAF